MNEQIKFEGHQKLSPQLYPTTVVSVHERELLTEKPNRHRLRKTENFERSNPSWVALSTV